MPGWTRNVRSLTSTAPVGVCTWRLKSNATATSIVRAFSAVASSAASLSAKSTVTLEAAKFCAHTPRVDRSVELDRPDALKHVHNYICVITHPAKRSFACQRVANLWPRRPIMNGPMIGRLEKVATYLTKVENHDTTTCEEHRRCA